jgi:hypothetical protein
VGNLEARAAAVAAGEEGEDHLGLNGCSGGLQRGEE